MEDLYQKFKKQFIQEILSLLEQLEKDLLVLENDPANRNLIDSIFRAMHTIKGTSGMYGCMFMSDFTHQFENIYQNIRDTGSEVSKDIIDISLTSLDHLKQLIDDENLQNPNNKKNHHELLNRIEEYLNASSHVSAKSTPVKQTDDKKSNKGIKSWYILVRTDEQIFFRGISLTNLLTDLYGLGAVYMHRIPSLSDSETEIWGIVLISDSPIDDIKEVFMFIEDNCIFTLIKEGDLLNPELMTEPPVEVIANFAKEEIKKIKEASEEQIQTIKRTQEPAQEPDKEKKELKTALLFNNVAKYNIKRINVDSSKLDYLMYLVSELITLNSQLLETTKDDYYEPIRSQIEQMESLVKLFRNNALEIRLVPLNELVVKFQRLVRDLSNQLGKKIEFVTHGTDIELDKSTIDLIAEPIIHILRNCIDHGIETPQERLEVGKPESGTLRITASHIGNYVHIKIEDDGKGINLNMIREKAIQKGLIKSTDTLGKKELTDLIFSSGLSTAKDITSVSGRGVGMDAVKKALTELRGEILVNTEEGKGSSFTLKIQQSVAIIDTLLFRVEQIYFIIPLTEIEICIHTNKTDLIKNQNTKTIEYNSQMIPYVDLRMFYDLKGTYPDVIKTLIVRDNGQYVALLSDEILGEQQAVLKPLGQAFRNDTGILAATQHGEGKWAYMLSASALYS